MTTIKTEIGVHKRQAHHTRFSPTGNIESTDVQRAIEEVSTDSAPSDGTYYVASANANLSAEIVVPAFMQSVLDDTTQGAARTTLGVGATDNPDFAGLFLTEKAAAEADVAGSGQFWVQTATPNLAMFTDDAGTDFSLANFENLASNSNGLGASLIGIEDAGGLFTATEVESALAENRTAIDAIEADYLTSSDIGSSVQAWDADLDAIAALSSADGNFIVGSATGWVVESGATARASMGAGDVTGPASSTDNAIARYHETTGEIIQNSGVTIDDSNNVAGVAGFSLSGSIELGHASDTTIARSSAGNVSVEGNLLYRAGGTDVPIADGGTGQSTASAAFNALKQAATESATGVVEWATTAEVRAANAASDQVIRARSINEASALVTLTDAATVAVNWAAGINFTLTLTTDRILGNPTNEIPGTWRTVFVISDGGPDELTFGSEYGGAPPTLDDITTTKGYLLSIYCRATSQFLVFSADGSPA